MTNVINDFTNATVGDILKTRFAKELTDISAHFTVLGDKIKFNQADSIGRSFIRPIFLTLPHGTVRQGSGTAGMLTTGSDQQAPFVNDITAQGSQMGLAQQVTYEIIARAANGDVSYVKNWISDLGERMMTSLGRDLDIDMLYGQDPLALNTGATWTAVDATHSSIVIPAAERAPGLWNFSELTPVDVYLTTGAASPLNTVGAMLVSSFNPDTWTLTISGAAADNTAIVAAAAGTAIYFRGAKTGASTYSCMLGLIPQFKISSGTLFGVDVGYTMWRRRYQSGGSAVLSFATLNSLCASFAGAFQKKDLYVGCSTKGWADIMAASDAQRQFDYSYKTTKVERGADNVKFYSQTGSMDISANPYIKPAHCVVLDLNAWERIGASDLTFNPGGLDQKLAVSLNNNFGIEIKLWGSQALVPRALCSSGYIDTLV